jgi:hypothetical protein
MESLGRKVLPDRVAAAGISTPAAATPPADADAVNIKKTTKKNK